MEGLPGWAIELGDEGRRLVAAELDRVGVEGRADLVELLGRSIDRDGDDRRSVSGWRSVPHDASQMDSLAQRKRSTGARDQVQPDRIGAGAYGCLDAGLVGDPADLHEGHTRHLDGVGRWQARAHERPRGGVGVTGTDKGLADERGVEAERAPAADRRGVADAGFGDDEAVVRDQLAQARGPLRIHGERAQVAVVDADHAGAGGEGRLDLAFVVRLDERLEPELERAVDQARERAPRVEHGEQQDRVGAGGAQEVELARVDDELLGEHRQGDGGAHGGEVVHGPAEPVGLAQDGDGGRTTGLVGAGASHDVVGCRGDLPGRRRAALDLGDQVEAWRREALRERARRRGGRNPAA